MDILGTSGRVKEPGRRIHPLPQKNWLVSDLPADDTCAHLIGCVYVNAILDVFQGFVQVARAGGSEKTVACICLQPWEKEGEKGRREGRRKEGRTEEKSKIGRKDGRKEIGIEENGRNAQQAEEWRSKQRDLIRVCSEDGSR